MHVTKTAMVVDAGFVIFFIVAVVKREVKTTLNSLKLQQSELGWNLKYLNM